MAGRIWTKEEDDFIRQNMDKLSYREIGEALNRGRQAVKTRAPRVLGLVSKFKFGKRIYSYDQNFWDIPNPLNSFYAGVMMSDGCIQTIQPKHYAKPITNFLIKLGEKDNDWLETFKNNLGYDGKISTVINRRFGPLKDGRPYSTLKTFWIYSISDKWRDDLAYKFGIVPQKTKRLSGPPALVDKNHILSFICGYICGDGGIYIGEGLELFVCSSSKGILEYIKAFYDKEFPADLTNQKTTEIKSPKRSDVFYEYRVHGLRAATIIQAMRQLNIPRLARKFDSPELIKTLDKYFKK